MHTKEKKGGGERGLLLGGSLTSLTSLTSRLTSRLTSGLTHLPRLTSAVLLNERTRRRVLFETQQRPVGIDEVAYLRDLERSALFAPHQTSLCTDHCLRPNRLRKTETLRGRWRDCLRQRLRIAGSNAVAVLAREDV
jgi:hypothetical protein